MAVLSDALPLVLQELAGQLSVRLGERIDGLLDLISALGIRKDGRAAFKCLVAFAP